MVRGKHPKKVNEHFFDKESKAMYYILGAFYADYIPKLDRGIIFRSSHKDLVQIVKDQMGSDHSLISDPRDKESHWIGLTSVPYLRSKLEEIGLVEDKSKRIFPSDINKYYISHFVRGFLDASGRVYVIDGRRTSLCINFNRQFLIGLHQTLVLYAKVQRHGPTNGNVSYGHEDALKIHDFIYSDCRFIEKHGLYLSSKKELFIHGHHYHPLNITTIAARRRRIDKAKRLLSEGKRFDEVAERVGYSHTTALCRAFRNVTGQTIGQYLSETK